MIVLCNQTNYLYTFFLLFHTNRFTCTCTLLSFQLSFNTKHFLCFILLLDFAATTAVSRNVTRAFADAPLTMQGKTIPKIDPKDIPEGNMLRHRVSYEKYFTCLYLILSFTLSCKMLSWYVFHCLTLVWYTVYKGRGRCSHSRIGWFIGVGIGLSA